jgi:predicted PurR-regulated permease PerM
VPDGIDDTGARDPSRSSAHHEAPASDGEVPRRATVELDVTIIAIVAVAVVAFRMLFGLVDAASGTLTRIGTGIVLGLALDPVVTAVRRRTHWHRSLAVAAVGAIAALVFALLVVVMGPPAVSQAERFGSELPKTVRQMYDFPIVGKRLERARAADKVEQWAKDLPGNIDTQTITDVTNSFVSGVAALSTILLIGIAVLLDGELIVGRARRLIPEERRDRADGIGRIFYRVLARYFAGSLFVAVIAGLYILAVGLALGVPLAPVAAVWMVFTDLIPQVGGFLGGVVFVGLAVTSSLLTGVIALVLYLTYLNIENHVIQPAIVGQAVNLSPPTTMLAALVGGAAFGVPGALIATPLVGTVKALYLEIRGQPVPVEQPMTQRLRRFRLRLPWRHA